jgi:hypothetical protein
MFVLSKVCFVSCFLHVAPNTSFVEFAIGRSSVRAGDFVQDLRNNFYFVRAILSVPDMYVVDVVFLICSVTENSCFSVPSARGCMSLQ